MESKQYTTSLPDGTAVDWRPLKWGEYRKLESTFEGSDGPAIWHLYDAVAGLCIVGFICPIATEYEDLPAGVIECIGEMILAETGFVAVPELLQKHIDRARQDLQSDYYRTGAAFICTAFHMKPSDIDEMTVEEFMNYLAMAELTLGSDMSIRSEGSEKQAVKYREVIDPNTGKTLRVPIANQGLKQSKVEIQDGRRQS